MKKKKKMFWDLKLNPITMYKAEEPYKANTDFDYLKHIENDLKKQ